MAISRVFTLGNAIRAMIFGGLVALIFVVVQSCQVPNNGLDRFANGSMRKLKVLEAPPPQPGLAFSLPDGSTKTLADYKGQVVLLNVWATWCPPCVAEMPTLNNLQAQRGGEDFQIVTVSIDRTLDEARIWLEKNNIDNLPPLHDGTYSLPQKIALQGVPISVFYDRQGREIARLSGEANWESSKALELIDYLTE